MAFKTGAIIQRKYEEMFNSKLSSLAIILGPIIMILIVGIALSDNSLVNIRANIYFGEESEFSQSLIDKLSGESFNLQVSPTLGDCRWPVLEGSSQVCIEISKRETQRSLLNDYNSYGYEVKLHVDFSKQRTVWAVINAVRILVEEESKSVQIDLADKLKEKISSTIIDIDAALDEATMVENELNQLSNEIDVAQYKIVETSISVMEAEQTIEEIGTLISTLESYGVDVFAPTEFADLKSKHYRAEEDIQRIKSDLEMASESLKQIEEKIPPAIQKLRDLEVYLREIQNNLVNVREINLNELLNPVPLTYIPVSGGASAEIEGELGLIDYLFPSFLIFFIMFASIILSTSSTIKERSSPAYIRNILSRIGGVSFILGNFITTFSIVTLQAIIIILIGSQFIGLNIIENLIPMISILTIAIAWFILIGQVIGYSTKSSESSTIVAVSLALILLIFMPSITPTETLPGPISEVVKFLPSNIFETQIRAITLFGVPFGLKATETIAVTATFIFLIIILSILYTRSKRKEI